ncbi:MAG: Hpt domain-containing protein [Oscillospiraceae bacterium]|nr:Hpt domain-containing protein [Oscillospiraceae bacterium]
MGDTATYINLEEGLGRVRGNQKLYARMLGMFIANKEMALLEEKLAAGDLQGGAEVAHAIKGMTGNLSLTALFEVSATLMEKLGAGEIDQDLVARYREVAQKTLEVAGELEPTLKG